MEDNIKGEEYTMEEGKGEGEYHLPYNIMAIGENIKSEWEENHD